LKLGLNTRLPWNGFIKENIYAPLFAVANEETKRAVIEVKLDVNSEENVLKGGIT
jgi:hypothetical protein